jgi:uncharacterized protein YqcC (DUF446 family)
MAQSRRHAVHEVLADLLDEIEAELRTQGRWEAERPPAAALASSRPFSVDFLTLDQWLQWILLPRLRELITRQAPLPTACAIRPMAEETYGGQSIATRRLVALLGRVDRLLTRPDTPPA